MRDNICTLCGAVGHRAHRRPRRAHWTDTLFLWALIVIVFWCNLLALEMHDA